MGTYVQALMLEGSVGGHVFVITKWAACNTVGLFELNAWRSQKTQSEFSYPETQQTKPRLAAAVNTDQICTLSKPRCDTHTNGFT